ncbi:hypothetical protein BYT27DRAFT_7218353 [Phlegmacium glaucopus]|nr:hypothetical protein BYT27DRAFT_7218353 [Phlegmacium glaucopus]
MTPTVDVSSDSGTEETDLDLLDAVQSKIPKPRGQAGHPGSGGYSLDIVLQKWGSSLIADVNKLVKQKADQLLDTSHSYRMQNSAEIDDICIIIGNTFPIVAKYQKHWPVRDMLKQHLKYTSESSRKEKKGKARKQ